MSQTTIPTAKRAKYIARVVSEFHGDDEMTYADLARDHEFPGHQYLHRWCILAGEFRGEEFDHYILSPYHSKSFALANARVELLDEREVPLLLFDTEEQRFWQCEVEINLTEGSLS